jgi:FAD/FMN-containing dehydrogenase
MVTCGTDQRLALARLRETMIDPARFSTDHELISSYVETGYPDDNLLAVVFPRSQTDIRQILEVARINGLAVYTRAPWGVKPDRKGILMDFDFMSDVMSIDEKNLFLELEPGVTWEQVLPELSGHHVRLALPAAAKSRYVLECAMQREITLPACRFANNQLSTFFAVLADGTEYRSGSEALTSSVAHWREDGGPNISRVFKGSHNIFGIPTRAFIYLYPLPEARKVVAIGLSSRKQCCKLAARAARVELGTEVLILSRDKAKEDVWSAKGMPAWTVIFGLEGTQELVEYQARRLNELAAELKLTPKPMGEEFETAAASALDKPWYAPEVSLGFYTNWSRVDELSDKVETALKSKGKLAQMVMPVKRGASVYVQYDMQGGTPDAAASVKKLLPALADAGAFFPDPTGSLAMHIFKKQPVYLRTLRQMKQLLDPEDILNSGQVVEV